jgi:hypothetical protein
MAINKSRAPDGAAEMEQHPILSHGGRALPRSGVVNPPAPVWQFPASHTKGPVNFILMGRAGDTWQIDASTDLLNWTTILTHTLTSKMLWFSDPAATKVACRFYRAMWRP